MMHSGAALLKLTELPYSGPTLIFVKTLLNKKYSLPYQVIEALVKYFVRFKNDERQMPVIWHQTLLVFAQRFVPVPPIQRPCCSHFAIAAAATRTSSTKTTRRS